MSLAAFRTVARHPAAIVLRLLLWPTAIVVLGYLAAGTQDDALAAGFMGFVATVTLSFLLALTDGLVLRTRPLLLVSSITTVVVVGLAVAQPLTYAFADAPEGTSWDYAVHVTLVELPTSLVFFLILVGVPVALGAATGAALRRSVGPRRGQAGRTAELDVPQA